MEVDIMEEQECTAGIGDLKRMIWQLPHAPVEKKLRRTESRSRFFVWAMAAVVISAFLTWGCLNAILIHPAHTVPVRH